VLWRPFILMIIHINKSVWSLGISLSKDKLFAELNDLFKLYCIPSIELELLSFQQLEMSKFQWLLQHFLTFLLFFPIRNSFSYTSLFLLLQAIPQRKTLYINLLKNLINQLLSWYQSATKGRKFAYRCKTSWWKS